MAEAGMTTETISPPTKESLPQKENVIIALKSGTEVMKATPPSETDLEGKERWQYQMLEIEERLKDIENGGKGTKIVELKRKNGNSLKSQEEGIPVDALLRSLTQKIDDPTTSHSERIRILKIRADLAPHWKEYHRLPNRRGNVRYDARIDYEVGLMQKDGRSTSDLQKDRDKAQQILNDRKELFIPDPNSDLPPTEEKFTVGIVNYEQMLDKKAGEAGQTQLTEQLHMKKWWSPKEWFRVTKLRVGEQYYRELWTQRAKDLLKQANNPFAEIDVIKNVIINANKNRESHLEQQKSTVSRFIKTEAKERGFVRIGEEVMTSQDQAINQRVNTLFSRFARGEIDESQFKTEQNQFFAELKNNPSTAALFKDCDMYADNLLEVAYAVKQQYKAHKNLLKNQDHLVTVQLGNASLYAKTEQSVRLADKFVRWCQTSRFTQRGWLANPATAGLMFGLGVYGAGQIAGWGARTAMAVPVAGSAAGALFAGVRRWSDLKVDFAMNERDIAVSRDVTGKPRREALKTYSYDKKSSTQLKSQVQNIGDLSLETDQRELVSRIAETEIRSDFSEENHVDLITYESGLKTETNRLEFLEAMDEAKLRLIKAGVSRDQLNTWLNESRGQWRQTFTQNKEQQDKAFMIYKMRNAAGAAATSALFGFGAGLGIQEGLAVSGRILGMNVGQTVAEKAVNWAATQAGHPEIAAPPVSMEGLRGLYPHGGTTELGDHLKAVVNPDHSVSIIDETTNKIIGKPSLSPDGSLHATGNTPFANYELDNRLKGLGFSTNEIDNPTTKPSILSGLKEAAAQQRVETFQSGNIHGVFDGATGTVNMVDYVSKMEFQGFRSTEGIFSFNRAENPDVDFNKAKEFLAAAGFFNITEDTTPGATRAVDALEYFREKGELEKALRILWHDNNTPMHLNERGILVGADGKELQFYHHALSDGSIDLDMSKMISTPQGVNWDQTVDSQYSRVMKDIITNPDGSRTYRNFEMLITPNNAADNAREVIRIEVDSLGHAKLPEGTELRQFFDIKDGKPIQLARFIEVAHNEYDASGNLTGRTILSTSVGQGIDNINITEPGKDILFATPPDVSEITHNYVFDAIPPEAPEAPEAPPIIPIPFAPRHPLEPIIIPKPEYPYYNFTYDLFRRADGRPSTLADIIRFRSPEMEKDPRIARLFPPRTPRDSSSAEITLPESSSPEEGEKALKLIHESFIKSPHVYISLSGAIGDVVIDSAYLEGIRQYGEKLGQNKKITVVIPPNLESFIKPLAENLNHEVITEERYKGVEKITNLIKERGEKDAFVFEFEHHTGRPIVDILPDGQVVVNDLFAASAGLYDNNRSGTERFSEFFFDLLSIPPNQQVSIRPRIDLPKDKDQIFDKLKQKYSIDINKQQVALVVEASHQMKRYSLGKWREIIEKISQTSPNTEFNIIFNSQNGSYKEDELRNTFGKINYVRFVSGNLNEISVLLSRQNLVLANDTGLAHVAAILEDGPQVISLHVPAFPPSVWVTNLARHEGIVAPFTEDFHSEETNEDKKLINKIPPEEVVNKSLEILNKQSSLPQATLEPLTTSNAETLSAEMAIETDDIAQDLEKLKNFAKKDTLESKEVCEKSLNEVLRVLEGKDGIADLEDLPTIIIPDIHARREFLTKVLDQEVQEGPNRGRKIFDLLKEGKINIVCLGDGMHSEKKENWVPKIGDITKNQLLNKEMVNSLGTMKIIMDFKARYPETFHYLRGNHDDIAEVISRFYKFANESADVKRWIIDNFGEDFLKKWAMFEENLPLLARGKNFVASHAVAEHNHTENEIRQKDKNTTSDFTWTDNRGWEQARKYIVDTNLINLKMNPNSATWIIGHRKVNENDGRYREQFGNLIQINNPDEMIYAYVPNDKKFDPDKEVYKI